MAGEAPSLRDKVRADFNAYITVMREEYPNITIEHISNAITEWYNEKYPELDSSVMIRYLPFLHPDRLQQEKCPAAFKFDQANFEFLQTKLRTQDDVGLYTKLFVSDSPEYELYEDTEATFTFSLDSILDLDPEEQLRPEEQYFIALRVFQAVQEAHKANQYYDGLSSQDINITIDRESGNVIDIEINKPTTPIVDDQDNISQDISALGKLLNSPELNLKHIGREMLQSPPQSLDQPIFRLARGLKYGYNVTDEMNAAASPVLAQAVLKDLQTQSLSQEYQHLNKHKSSAGKKMSLSLFSARKEQSRKNRNSQIGEIQQKTESVINNPALSDTEKALVLYAIYCNLHKSIASESNVFASSLKAACKTRMDKIQDCFPDETRQIRNMKDNRRNDFINKRLADSPKAESPKADPPPKGPKGP